MEIYPIIGIFSKKVYDGFREWHKDLFLAWPPIIDKMLQYLRNQMIVQLKLVILLTIAKLGITIN